MSAEDLHLRQTVVFGSALIYWSGVLVQARRVRKRIGRAPNVRPRGTKERLLWLGWMLVVLAWMALPFLAGQQGGNAVVRLFPALLHLLGLAAGIVLVVGGYAGTLWCYRIMGNTWRMGVDRGEKTTLITRGPFAVVRHPIYALQVVMLAGVFLLLPTLMAVAMLLLHLACVSIKAADEESHLANVHGPAYRDYLARTGRLFPRFRRSR